MAKKKLQEIRIAVFGESGCGKTTLLSSFYCKQRSQGQEEGRDYFLLADDTSQGNGLLRNFFKMRDESTFPLSTDDFSEYCFSFFVKGSEQESLKIRWYDYPGKWWTYTPSDPEEIEEQKKCFSRLLDSHIGIFVVDGQKLLSNGGAYVRALFSQFSDELRRQKKFIRSQGLEAKDYPDQWIIVLSKADLFSPKYSAVEFQTELLHEAFSQINYISEFIRGGSTDDEIIGYKSYQFGSQFLLLSSAKAKNGTVEDSSETLGLELIAPLALNSTMRKIIEDVPKSFLFRVGAGMFDSLSSLIKLVNKTDDFLPRKYQLITQVIDILKLDEISREGAVYMKRRQDELVKKGKIIEAAAYAMASELKKDSSRRLFHFDHARGRN